MGSKTKKKRNHITHPSERMGSKEVQTVTETGALGKFFKLNARGTDVRTEVMAGLTTFMTMAYILAVNPSVLSAAGMDSTAVLLATCLASFIGTMCM